MACELEFYLLDQKPDANGRPQPALDVDGGRPRSTQVYGLRELEQIEPFLADLYSACTLQGIPARTAISEYAPGQVEITLEHRTTPCRRWTKRCATNAWSKAWRTNTG
jgi:glutamine synthetase